MAASRLVGVVDWYNTDRGFGVIIGQDKNQYFIHFTNLPHGLIPLPGQKVTFQARQRRERAGMEAVQVEIAPAIEPKQPNHSSSPHSNKPVVSSQKKPSSASPSNTTANVKPRSEFDSVKATREAAAEALDLQRQRKKGTVSPKTENFPPGTRVTHSFHGIGTVVLSAPNILSVRFDQNHRQILDLPRDQLQAAHTAQDPLLVDKINEPIVTSHPVTSPNTRRGINDISAVVKDLLRDAQETLIHDGIEVSGLYRMEMEVSAPPETPSQLLQINPVVARIFEDEGITTFYSHQIETRNHLLNGKHVVIATPTASGKTESYNPTILETLLSNPEATALYVFPLNALGIDQKDRLQRLNNALPLQQQLKIGIQNSSVSPEEKSRTLRERNRLLITTPDSLHYILLPKPYPNWKTFFRNLRYVVLDEAHIYKGVFGTNVGHIVRRLIARSMREGNRTPPQMIISSATVRDPLHLASQLTGLPAEDFAVVDKSGAPRPRRHFVALPQDVHDVVDIGAELLDAVTLDIRNHKYRPVRTIIFLRSIAEVKRSTEQLQDALHRQRRDDLVPAVADYYSDKADKNDVFARLRRGEVRCLFTTCALMAGIDIGSLDVAVVKNFPGLVMDARQMFGRAGRAGEGAAIFLANRTDPFDQFYLEKPELLFMGQTIEDVITNPDNPLLLAAHLKCSAQTSQAGYNNHEGPLSGEWAQLFGIAGADLLNIFVERQQLRVYKGAYYLGLGDPHSEQPLDHLRSAEGSAYRVLSESGVLLEEKRRSHAYRDAHPDAVFWHDNQLYKVVSFDDNSRTVVCRPVPFGDRTKAIEETVLLVERELVRQRTIAPGIDIGFGNVKITTNFSEYSNYQTTKVMRCRKRSCKYESPNLTLRQCPRCHNPMQARQVEKMIGRQSIPQPPELAIELDTQASWLVFASSVVNRFRDEFWPRWKTLGDEQLQIYERLEPDFDYAIHTVKHALLKAFPEQTRCDEGDIDSHEDTTTDGNRRLFINDTFPGGLGFAERLYDDPEELMSSSLDRLENCSCTYDEGCLVCLKYFRCRQFNGALSKLAGRYLLRLALGRSVNSVLDDLGAYVQDLPPSQVMQKPSPMH